MDSLTQLALGAAVGEAVLGKEEGDRAMLWGALAGTIPDLDILIYPFVSEVQQLSIHRGLSHSLLFACTASPPLGMLLSRLYKRSSPWPRWAKLLFWAFLTHALLDCFTSYGTQFFYPFSDIPVSFDTIFIIDPLYTTPLIIGLIAALWFGRQNPEKRALANRLGLLISSLYLLFTLCNKLYISGVFEIALQNQGIRHERLFSNPSPFNNILWYGVADDEKNLWVGSYSLFDKDRKISFQRIPKNEELIAPFEDQVPIERLLWFSKGYYTVQKRDNAIYFNDVRFLRSDFFLDQAGEYVFAFRLVPDPADSSTIVGIDQGNFGGSPPEGIFRRFAARVFGNKNP